MTVAGRSFTREDSELEHFIIVNQRLANELPGNAIGEKLKLDNGKLHTVVGVVSNTDYPGSA